MHCTRKNPVLDSMENSGRNRPGYTYQLVGTAFVQPFHARFRLRAGPRRPASRQSCQLRGAITAGRLSVRRIQVIVTVWREDCCGGPVPRTPGKTCWVNRKLPVREGPEGRPLSDKVLERSAVAIRMAPFPSEPIVLVRPAASSCLVGAHTARKNQAISSATSHQLGGCQKRH